MIDEKLEKVETGDLWLNISNQKESVKWKNISAFLKEIYKEKYGDVWIESVHTSNIARIHNNNTILRVKYYVGTYRINARVPFYQCPKSVYDEFGEKYDEMVVLFFQFNNEEGSTGKIINRFCNCFISKDEINSYWKEEKETGSYRLNYSVNNIGEFVADELKMVKCDGDD